MNATTITRPLAVALSILAVAACAPTASQQAQSLVSPLPKLTTAIVSEIRYGDLATPPTDDQLVATAIKNKPELQQTFARYPIKVLHDTKNAVVLVCSPDGKLAWLEDASWTRDVDHQWYLCKRSHPAEFTIDLGQAKGNRSKMGLPTPLDN